MYKNMIIQKMQRAPHPTDGCRKDTHYDEYVIEGAPIIVHG
jgi:hypothetical protein